MWKDRVNRSLVALTGYQLRRVRPQPRTPKPSRTKERTTQGPRAKARRAKARRAKARGTGQVRRPGQHTVAQGWDAFAVRRREEARLGDHWNAPKLIGLDVERPEDVVPYLDAKVFAPFLGTVDTIVEIGPGGGRFTEVLLPKCTRLLAVDTSPTMLAVLAERFGAHGGLECVLSDGRGLSGVADSSVHAGFSYGVFVHLQHWDIYNYLCELERVLVPGGKAVVQHSNTFSELGWQHFKAEVPRQLNRHKLFSSFILNSPEIMAELAGRAGLEVVDSLTDVVRRDCITLLRKPG